MYLTIALPVTRGLSGGSSKYLAELVPRLQHDPHVKRIVVLAPPSLAEKLQPIGADAVVSLPGKFWTHNSIQQCLRDSLPGTFRPDIVFTPTSRLIGLNGVPQVVMFRNMEPPLVPLWKNPLRESMRNMARLYAARRACHLADGVIAVSKFVADFLISRWRVPSHKVATVYHGVNLIDAEFAGCREAPKSLLPFVLTAGSIRPARGLEDVLRALEKLGSVGWQIPLRIAGAVDSGMERYYRRLRRMAATLGVAAQVEWLGAVPRDELLKLMLGCRVFVVTSRAEACPNVVLEAMACGCSIVSTLQPPMPELLAEGALYYPPGNSEILADQILRAYRETDPAREERRRAALFRASAFSWDRTAAETLLFLQQVLTSAARQSSNPLRRCA